MSEIMLVGQEFSVQNVDLNATSYVEVAPPSQVHGFRIRSRTAVDILLKRKSADTKYFTIPANSVEDFNLSLKGSQTFWLMAASATPVAEIVWFK